VLVPLRVERLSDRLALEGVPPFQGQLAEGVAVVFVVVLIPSVVVLEEMAEGLVVVVVSFR